MTLAGNRKKRRKLNNEQIAYALEQTKDEVVSAFMSVAIKTAWDFDFTDELLEAFVNKLVENYEEVGDDVNEYREMVYKLTGAKIERTNK